MEEELSKDDVTKSKKKLSFLPLLARLTYILSFFLVVILIGVLFWGIATFVYNKKGVFQDKAPTQGTLDVYAKKEKSEPLATLDLGEMKFEIPTMDPLSSSSVLMVHIVIAYKAPLEEKGADLLSKELLDRKLQIQDITRDLFIRKSYSELADTKKIVVIKKELLNRINHVLVNKQIADIYFTKWDIASK